MSAPEMTSAFTDNAKDFAAHAETVAGYVRYEVVHRNLAPFIGAHVLNVLDVGGGSGIDALWLAEQGHTVTVIDPAQEQLDLAKERIGQAAPPVRKRITLLRQTADDLLAQGQAETFDLVLSHGVAMYVDDPETFVARLVDLIKPGAHISLLEKGRFARESELVNAGRWEDLTRLQMARRVVNSQGRQTQAFVPRTLRGFLKQAGAKVEDWSGVRVLSETMRMPITDLTPEQRETLIKAEIHQGHRHGVRETGQMLHFIGKKLEPTTLL